MLNRASDSGRQGESYTLHFLFDPLCLLRKSLVVDACALRTRSSEGKIPRV